MIATLARQAVERGIEVVVVSADKDLLQLVQEHVRVLNPGREGSGSTSFDRRAVEEKWGVPPGADRGRAGARRGRGRQRARRRRDRRQGRARPGARVRVGRGGARERRQGEARGLPRGAEGAPRRRAALEAARDAAPRRAGGARPRRARASPGPTTRPRARALQGARVPGARARVRAGARPRRPAPTTGWRRARPSSRRSWPRRAPRAGSRSRSWSRARRRCARSRSGSRSRGRPAARPTCRSATRRSTCRRRSPRAEALAALRPLLEDPAVPKVSAHAKRDQVVLERLGRARRGPRLRHAARVLPARPGPARLRARGHRDGAPRRAARAGDRRDRGPGRAADPTSRTAGAEAELVLRLEPPMQERLEAEGLRTIYESMEMPLVARARRHGARRRQGRHRAARRDEPRHGRAARRR